MADTYTPLPVKTKAAGDVIVKVADKDTPSQHLAVDGSGRLTVLVSGTIDTELPAAASLADNTVNPTVPSLGAFLHVLDGATWDRVTGNSADGLDVDVTRVGGNVTVINAGTFAIQDSEKIADNAGFTDGTTKVLPVGFIFDETPGTGLTENDVAAARLDSKRAIVIAIEDATTRGRRLTLDASGYVTTNINGTVDTELPAAAALSETTANPTTPMVGAALMGWDGSANWKRLRINGSNELVVTTSGASGAPTSPKKTHIESAAITVGNNANLDGAQITDLTTGKLMKITVGASIPCKWTISTVLQGSATVIAVLFTLAGTSAEFEPPHKDFYTIAGTTGGGLDAFRVNAANLDPVVGDASAYATITWDEV